MNEQNAQTSIGMSTKIHLDRQINTLAYDINEKRTSIREKYNKNIIKELNILQNDQEGKILKFINAIGKSQMSIHKP